MIKIEAKQPKGLNKFSDDNYAPVSNLSTVPVTATFDYKPDPSSKGINPGVHLGEIQKIPKFEYKEFQPSRNLQEVQLENALIEQFKNEGKIMKQKEQENELNIKAEEYAINLESIKNSYSLLLNKLKYSQYTSDEKQAKIDEWRRGQNIPYDQLQKIMAQVNDEFIKTNQSLLKYLNFVDEKHTKGILDSMRTAPVRTVSGVPVETAEDRALRLLTEKIKEAPPPPTGKPAPVSATATPSPDSKLTPTGKATTEDGGETKEEGNKAESKDEGDEVDEEKEDVKEAYIKEALTELEGRDSKSYKTIVEILRRTDNKIKSFPTRSFSSIIDGMGGDEMKEVFGTILFPNRGDRYKGKTLTDVFKPGVEHARSFFKNTIVKDYKKIRNYKKAGEKIETSRALGLAPVGAPDPDAVSAAQAAEEALPIVGTGFIGGSTIPKKAKGLN